MSAEPLNEYMEQNSDNVYLCNSWTRTIHFTNTSLTLNADMSRHNNIYDINGDWYIYTPYWYMSMNKLGLSNYTENSMMALLDEKVRYISSVDDEYIMDDFCTYFDEHYDMDVTYECEQSFDGTDLSIYRLYEKEG